MYILLFSPVVAVTTINSTTNASNTSNSTISPLTGMILAWPDFNDAVNDDLLNPQEIILNNSNQTVFWSSNSSNLTDLQELFLSVPDYENFEYYVDVGGRIILNQPETVFKTEDLYASLITRSENQTFVQGNYSLQTNLLSFDEGMIFEVRFENIDEVVVGLSSFCELRENSTGKWNKQYLMFDENKYVSSNLSKTNFMYELTCSKESENISLFTVGFNKVEIEQPIEEEVEEEFELVNTTEEIIVEDMYVNLTDEFFENKTSEEDLILPNETNLLINYFEDGGDLIFEASYLNKSGEPLFGLSSFCELRENSTGNWSSPYLLFYDSALGKYQTVFSADKNFWAQISCYTKKQNEENLSLIEIIDVEKNKIQQVPLSEELIGYTTNTNFSSGTSHGVFNLQVDEGVIKYFNVDENLTINFRIENLSLGQELDVNLNLPMSVPKDQHLYIWKEINETYIEVPYTISEKRDQIILHLKDGLIDDDRTINGVIVDPFKLILADESTEVTTTSNQSSLIALGSKKLDVTIDKGVLGEVFVVDPKNLPETPLPPHSFDYNLLKLNITGFEGEGVDVTFHYSEPIIGSTVWKFNPRKFEWYTMPYELINETTLRFTIIDGGLGDDDGIKNGIIIDDVGITVLETKLQIYDDSDYNNTIYQNEMINFFANYTNTTDNNSFVGANCTFAQNITGTWNASQMIYNSSLNVYTYLDNYSNYGIYYYKINCSHENATTLEVNETFTITRTPKLTDANYSTFAGNTTDFNFVANQSAVENATVQVPAYGSITWNTPINATSQDFDTNIQIIENHIFVNSSVLHSSINSSANLTLYNLTWVNPIIYRDGVKCDSCEIISYESGTLKFNVTGFSTYTTGPQTNLSINDTTDSKSRYVGQNITFYAYYTNITSGLPITGVDVECNFTQNSTGTWSTDQTMNYNTNGYYEINDTTGADGTFYFNVSCINTQGYANLSVTDDFFVDPIPTKELFITNVSFSNNNPAEDDEITITVNISNTGSDNATNFTTLINFSSWNGTHKNYIATNISELVSVNASSWNTVEFNWDANLGLTVFDVFVDNQNNITELVETNNTYETNISVDAWTTYYGNMTTNVVLGDATNATAKKWSATPYGVMIISDVNSEFNVDNLESLNDTGDLSELDIALSMTGFEDSVSKTYDSNDDGDADSFMSLDLIGRTISEIPAYSLPGSSFKTGILYDSNDGAIYDGSQDVVFVIEINASGTGTYGASDYEVYFPAKLRDLASGTSGVQYLIQFD